MISSIWKKLRNRKVADQEFEEDWDFLDSSASDRLKQSCRQICSSDQVDEFENYSILEELGRGNMGIVYKALQRQEKKIYALKVMPKNVTHNPQAIDQFFKEICVHKSLSHPNIIHFHKIGVCKETVFIVMEYVLGNDLDTVLRDQIKLPALHAMEFVIQIAEVLEHAHNVGIVHRDLKPSNILIDEARRCPKVADFGMAKFSTGQNSRDHAFGTPAYMAPEQVISSKSVDIRADIYALGSILYHMLSGKRPYFEIQDPVLLVRTKIKKQPKPITKLLPQLPKPLAELIHRSMERIPQKRYENPSLFLEDARKALEIIKENPATFRKASQRPSEKLKEEALQESDHFLPVGEVPELFMTATRYEVEAAVGTFQREFVTFQKSPVGSLLQNNEEEKAEFEETLLTMTMAPGSALNIPKDLQRELLAGKKKSLLEVVVDILQQKKIKANNKSILQELRYLLLLRGNTLTKQKSLIDFVNRGKEHIEFKLDEMSRVSQSESINKKIRKYFQTLIEVCLKNYDQRFIQDLLSCRSTDEVVCYLKNYIITRHSLIKNYRNLQIIKRVKEAHREMEKSPEQVERICRKTFAAHEEELSKLFIKHYLKSGDDENTLWMAITRANNLSHLVKHLMRFQEKKQWKGQASRIISLIEVFLDSGGRTSLNKLKTSLNFMPQQLRDKICMLVRKRLSTELESKVRQVLVDDEQKRFKALTMLLQNTRYHDPKIKLYGYQVKTLANKINQLRRERDSADQIFREHPIPQEILGLVLEDKQMEISARACTLGNCLYQLEQLDKQYKSRQSGSLLKSLMSILNRYGKVNFAMEDSIYAVNGYELSRHIVRFYNDAGRTTIKLPKETNKEISQMIKTMVDRERERQLRQMATENKE